jgi:hypothetical protein
MITTNYSCRSKSNQDPERIPAEALERAIRTATAELREAADLARKAEK